MRGVNAYLQFLSTHAQTDLTHIALSKFTKFTSHSESNQPLLSDLCVWSHVHCDDELIVLDAHLRTLHLMPLRPTRMALSADIFGDRARKSVTLQDSETVSAPALMA